MKHKILLFTMTLFLLFSICGCTNKTIVSDNKQNEIDETIEYDINTEVEEKAIDIVPLLNSTLIYMYENNGVYNIQNEDCYWGILQRMFSLYDINKEKDQLSVDLIKKYGNIICYFDKLPEIDNLDYVKFNNDFYSFTKYKNNDFQCKTVYMNEDEVGNIDTTIRLYNKNNKLLGEANFSLEKKIKQEYENNEFIYTIRMIEYFKEGNRMIAGNIKEISLEEIIITSGGRDFKLTYLDNEIRTIFKDMKKDEFVMVLTNDDIIIEDHTGDMLGIQ